MADHVFLDANVVLDHLADRQPFSEYAHRIFALAETGQLTLCVSSISICNLHYLLRKLNGNDQALALLDKLTQLVEITTVGSREIRAALASGFKDFEDAVQTFSAVSAENVDVVLTRNKKDFLTGIIPVLSPEEYLTNFEKSSSQTG